MRQLRNADEQLLPQVQHTIAKLTLQPEDSAAATLAERYAAAIDEAACGECGSQREALDKLGHRLLSALEALGATPRARAAGGKVTGGAGGGKLAAVRAAARPA